MTAITEMFRTKMTKMRHENEDEDMITTMKLIQMGDC